MIPVAIQGQAKTYLVRQVARKALSRSTDYRRISLAKPAFSAYVLKELSAVLGEKLSPGDGVSIVMPVGPPV